ncbi:protein sax-3-like [Varroa jacobsoni]|uniref:protein sax-3-like n=1 Tax=Varroa jacobsoni TaxID=62625 RepID=UPI000BF2ADAC|nr:protein sax-3-like [Varroa jacobsoni]
MWITTNTFQQLVYLPVLWRQLLLIFLCLGQLLAPVWAGLRTKDDTSLIGSSSERSQSGGGGSISGLPKIIEHPRDLVALRDDPAQLDCGTENADTVQWFHKGRLIRNKLRTTSSLGVLYFLSVSHADAGVYYCEASNARGTVRSKNVTVSIAYLREEFKASPANLFVSVGETAVLECNPPPGLPKPHVLWLKEGQTVNVGSGRSRIRLSEDSGNLVIQDVRPADSGNYICKAENLVGIRETPAARLRVHSVPYFIIRPEDTTVVAYDADVRLDCSAGGEPIPVIRWAKKRHHQQLQSHLSQHRDIETDGDERLTIGGRFKVSEGIMASPNSNNKSSSSLEILSVVPEDEGDYVCVAENEADKITATARVTVHARPVFLVRPQDAKVSVNGIANFACMATGNPRPNIYWTREGHQANLMFPNNTYGRIRVDHLGGFSIADVNKDDEGFYVCSALSAIGSIMTKAHLEVSGLGDLPPPVIELGPVNQTIPEGQPATLPCETSGLPRPEVQWFFNNKDPIDEDDDERFNIDSQGTLTIQDLRFEDSGVYTCVASSDSGETRQAATLTVAPVHDPNVAFSRAPSPALLPAAPSRPRAVNISDTSVTLVWDRSGQGTDDTMGAMGGSFNRVKAYTIEYFSADLKSGWVTVANRIGPTELYTITSLKPDTRYVFLIRAENALGTGRPSELSKVIRTVGSRTASAPDHYLSRARTQLSITEVTLRSVKAVNSTSLSLDWIMAGDKDFVEGFYIRFKDMVDNSNKYNMVTVWGSKVTRYVLKDLKKFTKYELFLVPFYRSVEGPPSNTRAASTLEDAPSAPVTEISVNVVNTTSVWVQWKPPSPQHRNGVLLGYKLLLLGAIATTNQNVLTNSTNYVFVNLIDGMRYKLQVLPYTAAGDGPPSHFVDFSTDELSQQPVSMSGGPLLHNQVLVVLLGCIFAFLVITACILFYFCRNRHALKTTVSAVPPLATKGGDINNCFTASLTHHPGVGLDTWAPMNDCYGDANKGPLATTTTVYENKLSALEGISYCAEYALPNVKESEYAEVGQNLNTFGKRYQGSQLGHTPKPYASTALIHGPLDAAVGGATSAAVTRGANNVAVTLKSLASRGSDTTRYTNAGGLGGICAGSGQA